MEKQLRIKRNSIPNNEIINIVITLVFFILNMILLQFHETWLDEVQAWQIQKYSSIFEIYSRCRTEGHPMLWYLILKPFTMFGFPIKTMNVISIIFMTLAVYLFLKYVDANKWLKILIVFGGSMFYYNAVNARTYSLVCLAMVLIDITYKNRKEHPYKYNLQLLLLTQTHILTCGFIAGFWLVEVYEMIKDFGVKGSFVKKQARNRLYGLLIYSFGIVWLLAQLAGIGAFNQYSNGVLAVRNNPRMGTYKLVAEIIAGTISSFPTLIYNCLVQMLYQLMYIKYFPNQVREVFGNLSYSFVIFIAAAIISVVLLVHLWNTNKKYLFVISLGVQASILVSYFTAGMNVSRLLVIMASVIILQASENNKGNNSVDKLNKYQFIVLQLFIAVYGWAMAVREIYCTFGMDTAQVSNLVEYVEDDSVIVVLDDKVDSTEAVMLQYLTDRQYLLGYNGKYMNYMMLDGYSDADYMSGDSSEEAVLPIRNLINSLINENVAVENVIMPLLLWRYTDLENDDFGDSDNRLSCVQQYFDVVTYYDVTEDSFVMQLGGGRIYLLKPNNKFIELYNQYKQSI